MTASISLRRHRDRRPPAAFGLLAALLVVFAAALILARTYVTCGWGEALMRPSAAQSPYGFANVGEDNLSYLAWIQQARLGHFWFTVLYTTDPHRRLFSNITLYAVGRTAALFNIEPAFALNLCGFAGALVAVALIFRYAIAIGLSSAAAFWASFLVSFGSGASWIVYVVNRMSGTRLPFGADIWFLNLVPSAIFQTLPYQCIGLAVLAGTLLCAARLEKSVLADDEWGFLFAGTSLGAFALVMSRPYEPVGLLVAYSCYTAIPALLPRQRHAFRARLITWSALALPIAIITGYHLWVSQQPVWSNMAKHSLNRPHRRLVWITGFGFVWILAALGVFRTFKRGLTLLELPAVWSVGAFLLLVVFKSGMAQLASGAFIGMALVSGPILDDVWGRLCRAHSHSYWAKTSAVVTVAVLSGVFSSGLLCELNREKVPTIDPEVAAAAHRIRQLTGTDMPTVLTDREGGRDLPGLGGIRVYAGHWMESPSYQARLVDLQQAGIEEGSSGSSEGDSETRVRFASLMDKADAQFVMIRRSMPLARRISHEASMPVVFAGERWIVFTRTQSLALKTTR